MSEHELPLVAGADEGERERTAREMSKGVNLSPPLAAASPVPEPAAPVSDAKECAARGADEGSCGDELYPGVVCERERGHDGKCAMKGVSWYPENKGRPVRDISGDGSPVVPPNVPSGTVSDAKENRVGILRPDLLEDDPPAVSDAKVEALRVENERLREALKEISETYSLDQGPTADGGHLRGLARDALAAVSGEDR